MLDAAECERARLARDPAYDGRFYTGVRTTRILLPAGLPCSGRAIGECYFLPFCGCGRGCWLPALPQMPSRNRAIFARMERIARHGGAWIASDHHGGIGWQGRIGRRARGSARHWRATPGAALQKALASQSQPGRQDRTCSAREAFTRYDRPRNAGGRFRCRIYQLTPVQRGILRSVSTTANANPSEPIDGEVQRR